MATRIAFSTHHPDRMKELAGKPTRFPEKIVAGLDIDRWIEGGYRWDMREAGYNIQTSNIINVEHPKTTTIRSNYEYWKSKEGQLLQPFFWAGKPYRSKQVVFCPEVRLAKVSRVALKTYPYEEIEIGRYMVESLQAAAQFTQDEGFDHPNHFWMWFDQDFDGALLELESAEG